MSKRIFQDTLSDPDVPDAGAEIEDDVEPGKSGDSASDSEGQQSPLKSLNAEGQTGEATEEDSASDADDQQTPPDRLALPKRGDRIAPGNGKNKIGGSVQITLMPGGRIMAFIRADLAGLNKKAGITFLPPLHNDCKRGNILCDWMCSHSWITNKGYMQKTTLLCPLVERCGCPCEAKIEETHGQFIPYIHAEHTTAEHKDDSSRYLSVDKQHFARKAVKTAPMNIAAKLIKNVELEDSPTKQIVKLKRSVTRLIRSCSRRAKLLKVECDGVEPSLVTGPVTLAHSASLKRLADQIFLQPAVQQHIAGVQSSAPQCIDCFKTFCIGKTFVSSERCAILAFFNVFDLLDIVRCVARGYSVIVAGRRRVQGFVGGVQSVFDRRKHARLTLHALGHGAHPGRDRIGALVLGGVQGRKRGTKPTLTLPNCGRKECQTCSYIKELNDNQVVPAVMRCECDENLWRIDKPLGDNQTGFQNFCEKFLKVPARVCNTQVSAIPANNGTFKKSFKSHDVYKQIYELVLRLKDCSYKDAGVKLQDRFVPLARRAA